MGIIASVCGYLTGLGANITDLDQHSTDSRGGRFFMRLEFELCDLAQCIDELRAEFATEVAERLDMQWRLNCASQKKRMAILVSKHDHALLELLWKQSRGDLDAELSCVLSNHDALQSQVESFGIPFQAYEVTPETKVQAQADMLERLRDQVDLVVLARYMQILPAELCRKYSGKVINIHHSFLPSFAGARPYHQAYSRGVKLIGATCHYVTEDLDEGPIIVQAAVPVFEGETGESLGERVLAAEHRIYPMALGWVASQRARIVGERVVLDVLQNADVFAGPARHGRLRARLNLTQPPNIRECDICSAE